MPNVMDVRHAALSRVDDVSPYRSNCPVCEEGVLLVGRDPKCGRLLELDTCVACGQMFRYLDIEDMREQLR